MMMTMRMRETEGMKEADVKRCEGSKGVEEGRKSAPCPLISVMKDYRGRLRETVKTHQCSMGSSCSSI